VGLLFSELNGGRVYSVLDVMRCDEVWWDVMRCDDEVWWDVMRCDEMWWGVMRCDEVCWGVMRCDDEVWWGVMRCDEVWWGVMRCDDCLLKLAPHGDCTDNWCCCTCWVAQHTRPQHFVTLHLTAPFRDHLTYLLTDCYRPVSCSNCKGVCCSLWVRELSSRDMCC